MDTGAAKRGREEGADASSSSSSASSSSSSSSAAAAPAAPAPQTVRLATVGEQFNPALLKYYYANLFPFKAMWRCVLASSAREPQTRNNELRLLCRARQDAPRSA